MEIAEFISRKFFWWIIELDMLIILLIALGVLLFILRSTKWARCSITAACALIILIGVFPFGFWMLEHLENRFPRLESIPADTTGVILLGGSFDRITTTSRNHTSYNLAGGRLIEFVKFARAHPQLKLVFTGGGRPVAFHTGTALSEAELTRRELEEIGFDTSQMVFESNSLNTIENATKTKELVNPQPEQKWILMTSAFHMPRSVGLFRKSGWNIIPYPVDYHTPGGFELYLLIGLRDGLISWHYALREWASMIQNYLYGRSDELYPAPMK